MKKNVVYYLCIFIQVTHVTFLRKLQSTSFNIKYTRVNKIYAVRRNFSATLIAYFIIVNASVTKVKLKLRFTLDPLRCFRKIPKNCTLHTNELRAPMCN